jgi:hypothetical protein
MVIGVGEIGLENKAGVFNLFANECLLSRSTSTIICDLRWRKADQRPKLEIDVSKVLKVGVFTLTPSTSSIPKSHYRCSDLVLLAWPFCLGGRT